MAPIFCELQRRTPVRHLIDLRSFLQQQPRHVDAARLLLENGAEVDRATKRGDTPLSIAKSQGHSSIAALLKKHSRSSGVCVVC